MKKRVALFLTLLILLPLSGCFVMQDSEEVADLLMQDQLMMSRTYLRASNVGVEVDLFTEVLGGRFERTSGNAQGSGVVYARDDLYYYALTNYHVVDDAGFDRVEYTVLPSYTTDTVQAELLAYDDAIDIAVLRFLRDGITLDTIDIFARYNDDLDPREMVLAVGNPSAVNSIVTYGLFIEMVDIADVPFEVILHSALIFPGNSGGALADLDGHLIGLNTWRSQGSDEMNLSIPLSEIHAFLSKEDLYIGVDE